MRTGIPRETYKQETRVAAIPETIKKYLSNKHSVLVERGAGAAVNFTDQAYEDASAILCSADEALACELVLKVRVPSESELRGMKPGTVLVGMPDPFNANGLARMTAAGTLKRRAPWFWARVWGGLQAIVTAKRLGAIVEASDVRLAAKEQMESLGAKFIDIPFEIDEEREIAQGTGGYARPMPAAWMARQAALVSESAANKLI